MFSCRRTFTISEKRHLLQGSYPNLNPQKATHWRTNMSNDTKTPTPKPQKPSPNTDRGDTRSGGKENLNENAATTRPNRLPSDEGDD